MDKKMKDIFENLSKEHMVVIRGGFALYDTINQSKGCTASNDGKNCDAVNVSKKGCQAINHAEVCGAINQGVSCIALNSTSTKCTVTNATKNCSGTSCI